MTQIKKEKIKMEKIRFKDLSLPLKIGIIAGWIYFIIVCFLVIIFGIGEVMMTL